MDRTFSPLHLPPSDLSEILEAVGDRWQKLRGQRLLLTGGTGFIGKWLLGSFLHANRVHGLDAKVVVISRNVEGFLASFPELRTAREIEWVEGDIRSFSLAASQKCAFAIHAATDVTATQTPEHVLDTCIEGTSRVIQHMVGAAGRLLLLSSGAVYGAAPAGIEKFDETWRGAPDPLSAGSAYGEGKRISELLCTLAMARSPGLEISIARCFAFVGPHLPLDKQFAIGNFIDATLKGQDIRIQGDGTPTRSYLYAGELAHWLWVMLFEGPSGYAFNVGGAETLSIHALARRVQSVLGATATIHLARQPAPRTAPQVYAPSLDRIGETLGLVPRIPLDEAIRRTAQWAIAQRETMK